MTTIIDQIRYEIKRLEGVDYPCDTSEQATGFYDALDRISRFLDTLQEQPCDTCTNDKGCVTCKDGELWEGKEQPCGDLEKEYEEYVDKDPVFGKLINHFAGITVARHFYILGLKNNIPVTQITLDELAKEGEPVSEQLEEAAEEYSKRVSDGHNYRDLTCGFIAGAEWQKSQLLKDAVKGTVCKDKKCVWIELIPNALPDYEDIEPVKCVVMKED